MWDMSVDPFETQLSALFLRPSGEADPARLTASVLERLEQEERRRRVVILSAAGAGAAIMAVVMGASGVGRVAALLAQPLSSFEALSVGSAPWVGVMTVMTALALAGLGATRAVREL